MLILPLHQPPNRENFPWVTLLLIAVNCVVYFGFQLSDEHYAEQASRYYTSSVLDELELDRYVAQLDAARSAELNAQWGAALSTPEVRSGVLLPMLQADSAFLQRLNAGEVITPNDEQYAAWKSAREYFNALWARQFTERWLTRYQGLDLVTIFSSTFLHGDAGHLLGNMVFLAILGLLVEGALGGSMYLLVYLLSGIGAGMVSLAWRYGDPGGGLGASGAIAGLMGAYGVLYGLRKVRVFYWFFVVMDYVRVPALLLVPVWLGWELLSLMINDGSNVAFDAHAGGIVTGALLGALILLAKLERRAFIDGSSESEQPQQQLAAAMVFLGKTEFAKAAAILAPLAEKNPHDLAIQRALYRLRRMMSPHAPPHDLAHRLLLEFSWKKDQAGDLEALFDDYLKAAHSKPKLSATELQTLALKLIVLDRLGAGERIARVLLAQPGTLEGGLNLLLKISERLQLQSQQPQAIALLREICQRAPADSHWVTRAKALVRGDSSS